MNSFLLCRSEKQSNSSSSLKKSGKYSSYEKSSFFSSINSSQLSLKKSCCFSKKSSIDQFAERNSHGFLRDHEDAWRSNHISETKREANESQEEVTFTATSCDTRLKNDLHLNMIVPKLFSLKFQGKIF